jgi:hypothetical protein
MVAFRVAAVAGDFRWSTPEARFPVEPARIAACLHCLTGKAFGGRFRDPRHPANGGAPVCTAWKGRLHGVERPSTGAYPAIDGLVRLFIDGRFFL